MGLEATCVARVGRRSSEGKARLEEKTLHFRGTFRLDIPLQQIRRAEAKRGALRVEFAEGVAAFDLGAAAEKWALKIRYPKPLIEKLGVNSGMRVGIVGTPDRARDAAFWRELEARSAEVRALRASAAAAEFDLVFAFIESAARLDLLALGERHIARNGAVWAIYPKGVKIVTEAGVMAAAKKAGLVDVKNVSFSETHSGLRLMVPLARR